MKRLFVTVLCLGMAFIALFLFSETTHAATEGFYTYSISNEEATITDCDTSISGSITIPSTLGGYPVTIIGDEAFYGCTSLSGIAIPDSVTRIGGSAFRSCSSLTSITIPDSVTDIGNFVFDGCTSLASVTIGNGITGIGIYTFYGCSSLASITIPDRVTSIGDFAFWGCSSLRSVPLSNRVTRIGDYAFDGCSSLTGITIPDSVTSIGCWAFAGCNSLANVTIPDGVTSIGNYAFYHCSSLTDVSITDLEAWCKLSFGNSSTNPLSNGAKLYINGVLVKDLVLPAGVVEIKAYAFDGCTSLTSITIPNSVTGIGIFAFSNCNSLCSVAMDNVISIGGYAFNGCTNLSNVTISDRTTSIGDSAFYGCSKLADVYITDLKAWCQIDFGGSSANPLCSGAKLYVNGTLAEDIAFPAGLTEIKKYVFNGCSSLTNVTIPDSVTAIGERAFSNCSHLACVTIGNGLTGIDNYTFNGCSSLRWVTIPDTVTTIGLSAFRGCNKLVDIHYAGTEEQWNAILIDLNNDAFSTAEIHYQHIYEDVVVAPTCAEMGCIYHVCTLRDDSHVDTYTDPLGHDWGDWEVIKEATEEETGEEAHTCTRCSAEETREIGKRACPSEKFEDLDQTKWYHTAIDYALVNNLFSGIDETHFAPNNPTTRAMFVAVLWRLEGRPESGQATNFLDVPANAYYAKAVAWAVENRIVAGKDETHFAPKDNVTREQVAAFLYRYARAKDYDLTADADLSVYPDADKVEAYATTNLSWAVGHGLISGNKSGDIIYLDPKGLASRAQVARILMLFQQNFAE